MLRSLPVSAVCLLAAAFAAPGAVRVAKNAGAWTIENDRLSVTVTEAAGAIRVVEKASGRNWTQAVAEGEAPRPFRNARAAAAPARGVSFDADFSAEDGSSKTLGLELTLLDGKADLYVKADMPADASWSGLLRFLPPFLLDTPQAAIVISDDSNGHLFPADLDPFPRRRFNMWRNDMPWAGVCDIAGGFGYSVILQTPEDAAIEVETFPRGARRLSAPRVAWTTSLGRFSHARRIVYHFTPKGGYVALAKRFREQAREEGLILTFAEKAKTRPNVRRLFGAPVVWGDSSAKFARDAKAAGVSRMVVSAFPRENVTPADIRAINEAGFLSTEYDNYSDMAVVQPGAPLDRSHDLASAALMKSDGTPVLGWLTYDKKTQYMRRCPIVRLDRARELVPKVLAEFPYLARMLDVDTNEDMYECFSPEHRMTRREKRAITNKTYGYMQSLGLVTGGEHGRWWAVPYVDYFEGMMTSSSAWAWPAGHLVRPKEKDFSKTASSDETRWGRYEKWAIGHQYRIPLWELVFHDCVVTTWYWGDTSDFLLTAAPEVTPKKDAFNVLYGTPAMLWANKEGSWTTARDVFLRSYRNTCKLHEAVGGTEMLSHEFLTPDRAAQRTRFSDGTVAVVNFGEKPYAVEMGGKKRLLPRNGFAVKGPRIEQYLELVDGRPVTSIRAPGYEFREPAERP